MSSSTASGHPFDWTAIACEFEKRPSRDGDPGLLVHVSKANSFLKTVASTVW